MAKYTEIKNGYWNAKKEDRAEILSKLTEAERTAWEVINMLEGRKGFDWWWNPNSNEGIPEECNDEIFAEMARIIARE